MDADEQTIIEDEDAGLVGPVSKCWLDQLIHTPPETEASRLAVDAAYAAAAYYDTLTQHCHIGGDVAWNLATSYARLVMLKSLWPLCDAPEHF